MSNQKKSGKSPWLQGWRESSLNFTNMFDQHVQTGDTTGDGENRLVTIQKSNTLIVYKGHQIEFERKLKAEQVIGVQLISINNPKRNKHVNRQAIAIILNSEIVFYENYEAYFKISLPETSLSKKEIDLYQTYYQSTNKQSLSELVQSLYALQNTTYLSDASDQLLSFENNKPQQAIYLGAFNQQDLLTQLQNSVIPQQIVCSSLVFKDSAKVIQQLLVATEDKTIYLMNDSATDILHQQSLSHIPSSLYGLTQGSLESSLIVIVFTRSHYLIKLTPQLDNKMLLKEELVCLDSTPIHLVQHDQNLLISFHNQQVVCLSLSLQTLFSIPLPSNVLAIQSITLHNKPIQGIIIALQDTLHLYNHTTLIDQTPLSDQIAAMRFGTYGKEQASLLLCYKTKGIDLKILPRQFNFSSYPSVSPPEESQVIPKKSLLYLQDQQREKTEYLQMHRRAQEEQLELKLEIGKEYLQLIDTGEKERYKEGLRSEKVRIDVEIEGLGPKYILKVGIENTYHKYLMDLQLALSFDHSLYSFYSPSQLNIPFLPPTKLLHSLIYIQHTQTHLPPSIINIALCQNNLLKPIINCQVQMPQPQQTQ